MSNPAGWYADPQQPDQQRYWDGNSWTDQGAPPATETTVLPLVSLIFGILGFIQCIPLIGGLVAVITGFMGRKKAKLLGQGSSLATVGIILGFVGIVISVVAAIVYVVTVATVSTFKTDATVAACQANVSSVDAAIAAYQVTSGNYPASATDLVGSYLTSMPATPSYTFHGPTVAPTHTSC